MGRVLLDRNAPALVNLAGRRWYGWAGDADSLWAHNILPLLSGDEMDATEYQGALLEKMLELARVEDAIEARQEEIGAGR